MDWSQARRWSWLQQLSTDIATSISKALIFHRTNTSPLMFVLYPRECHDVEPIAIMASSVDPGVAARGPLEGVDVEDAEGVETQTQEAILGPHRIIHEQRQNETLRKWRKIAELKNQVAELRSEVPEGQVTTPELTAKESAYTNAFRALKDKAVQGKVFHMFLDEQDVLVIAGSNRQNPIPVVTAETGAVMIELGHDSLVGIHTGFYKLYFILHIY